MRKIAFFFLLFISCILMQGCFYSRHFEDGFGLIFYANAHDLKDNNCYELDTTQFGDLIYSIGKQAEKVESPEIKKKIKEDLHLTLDCDMPWLCDDYQTRGVASGLCCFRIFFTQHLQYDGFIVKQC